MDREFFSEVLARGGPLALNTALEQLAHRAPQAKWAAAYEAAGQAIRDETTRLQSLLDRSRAESKELRTQAQEDQQEINKLRRSLSDDPPEPPAR